MTGGGAGPRAADEQPRGGAAPRAADEQPGGGAGPRAADEQPRGGARPRAAKNEPVRIRRAGERDFDALTDLWERSARTSHGFMSDDDFADVHAIVRDGLLPSMDVWVAEDGAGVPLGLLGARERHVELLYVEPTSHGQGIGSLLLGHLGADGPTSVEVYAGNSHGLGFYESHGFRRLRTHMHDAFGRPFPVIHLTRDPGR